MVGTFHGDLKREVVPENRPSLSQQDCLPKHFFLLQGSNINQWLFQVPVKGGR